MTGSLSVRSLTFCDWNKLFLSGPSCVLADYRNYVYGKWTHLEEVAFFPWKTAGGSCAPYGMDVGLIAALLGSLQCWAYSQAAFVTLCKFSLLALLLIQSTLSASEDGDF